MPNVYTDPQIGAPNVPNWQEDANSPITPTSVSTFTYTLASSYDEVMLRFTNGDTNAGSTTLQMQVNGTTTTDYGFVGVDGTSTSAVSQWDISGLAQSVGINPIVVLDGRWNIACGAGVNKTGRDLRQMQSGEIETVTSPLDSFTVFTADGSTVTYKVSVFGRNA